MEPPDEAGQTDHHQGLGPAIRRAHWSGTEVPHDAHRHQTARRRGREVAQDEVARSSARREAQGVRQVADRAGRFDPPRHGSEGEQGNEPGEVPLRGSRVVERRVREDGDSPAERDAADHEPHEQAQPGSPAGGSHRDRQDHHGMEEHRAVRVGAVEQIDGEEVVVRRTADPCLVLQLISGVGAGRPAVMWTGRLG